MTTSNTTFAPSASNAKSATQLNSSLAWEIQTERIKTESGLILPDYKVISRNDNGTVLNVAKQSYTPTPNSRMIEVVEKLQDCTGMKLAGYDEFKDGKIILSYLQAEENTKLMDWDMKNYMVIGNSHDGTTSFFIGTSDVMIRCMNQFSSVSQKMKAYHSKNNDLKIEQILRYFQTYQQEKLEVEQKMEKMQKVKIDEKIIIALTEKLFRMETGQEEVSTRKANLVESFRESVKRETGDLGMNLFGLFHGVTHYTTHVSKSEKVFGNVIGHSSIMNKQAMEFADLIMS
jgi:Domain of unknown function (DUF932).